MSWFSLPTTVQGRQVPLPTSHLVDHLSSLSGIASHSTVMGNMGQEGKPCMGDLQAQSSKAR